jgi:hypothetical protein
VLPYALDDVRGGLAGNKTIASVEYVPVHYPWFPRCRVAKVDVAEVSRHVKPMIWSSSRPYGLFRSGYVLYSILYTVQYCKGGSFEDVCVTCARECRVDMSNHMDCIFNEAFP